MSKIKHWNPVTHLWEIDGASNAANIELSNPGYLNENGESISVNLGFTKIDNRLSKIEHNVAWIYQNGAKGGSGMGGGGGSIDSTSYSIDIEEGTRIYTSNSSVTIHITITGGSVRKTFAVTVLDLQGNTKGTYVVTSLVSTEITINNLTDSTNKLTINANSGLNYAVPTTITVIAGAIKIRWSSTPDVSIYPSSLIKPVIVTLLNSTDSDLQLTVLKNGELFATIDVAKSKESQTRLSVIEEELNRLKNTAFGQSFKFEVYAKGVLNDTILLSSTIDFTSTIMLPGTLYLIVYDINESTPTDENDLLNLTKFVYGGQLKFNYQLLFSNNSYPVYDITYEVALCYFEDGNIVENVYAQGTIQGAYKDTILSFVFNTASLPDDTIDTKFVKVTLSAASSDNPTNTDMLDTKILYFVLQEAVTKYITATNINNSLIAYFSPVIGIPVNTNTWTYDNKNNRFPYNIQGIVQLRYLSLLGYNVNSFMSLNDTQGIHLLGNAYANLNLNLFSSDASEINLFNGDGWTISFTYRTNSNVEDSSVLFSLGKYDENLKLLSGIEIRANKVIYAVQTNLSTLNITKGDLTTIDIVALKYVGPGDTESLPTHWFFKTYLNGVLSLITSHTLSSIFNTDNNGVYGWYFNDYMHLGARVVNEEISDACSVHFYDFKVYSSALSDNEIILNFVSSYIYSELQPSSNPDMSTQNRLLLSNFILIGTDGNYHNMLFDDNDETQYKDANTLLNNLVSALAESRITYPIIVVNQISLDPNFLGVTESKFEENLKDTVMGYKFPIDIDYYTVGNQVPIKILHNSGQQVMSIGIQGTSSLRYNSKNYEIYMGQDEEGKDILVQMREDWLPENRYTLKADVMDSSHVNNVLIGRIINGLVTTTDTYGNEIAIKPLDNTPPMSKTGYAWADKVKHTSEGYPCILFIKFKTNSNIPVTKCMGIYNFNLGRYAYFNLGMKLLSSVNYTDTSEVYPRMIQSYTQELEVEQGSPVYSMEVQENSDIAMFDLDDANIINEGVFDFPYNSDGQGVSNLQKLLKFLAEFGYNIETDKKVYIDNMWVTPRLQKIDNTWQDSGRYYLPYDERYYVKSTLDEYMNWNNMVSYYIIAIVFGLVDSMAKNLTLRSWNKSSTGNIWYTCFYDMDTALRVNNVGAETVPYNAHLHRYYTDTSSIAESRVINHCPSISGVFNLAYSGYNTRLLEIVENCTIDSSNAKTLQSVYEYLRVNLFPDPAEFIDTYYKGLIDQVGSALYNYDYYLKYLQTSKTYDPSIGRYGDDTHNYTEISYLHGNGSTNVKDWFVKRIKFLDGVYGLSALGDNAILGITNTPLATSWLDNNATKISNISTNSVTLTLLAESQIKVTIATSGESNCFWIDETPRDYRVNNVGGTLVVTIRSNEYLTQLGKFNSFTWDTIASLNFPLIKELSLKNQTNIKSDNFLSNTGNNNIQSLIKLDLSGVTLIDSNANLVYMPLLIASQLPNLEELDVSNSTFNEVPLSASSTLRVLNLSGTKIKSLVYSNQPMLESINISNCNELETINLQGCPKLRTITIPSSVKSIRLVNCSSLESLIATYNDSTYISKLQNIEISTCEGLKYVNLLGQNNQELVVNLIGAYNLEDINLNGILTTNITFPSKYLWRTLKLLNLSNTSIGYLNYDSNDNDPSCLDLSLFTLLENIALNNNTAVETIRCSQDTQVILSSTALADCQRLRRIYGNFLISGTRVFYGCTLLILNDAETYANYNLLGYPVDFVNLPNVCNLLFERSLTSVSELFAGCSSLTGNDFLMIMQLLHSNIVILDKMFLGCVSIDAEIHYDLFRHCPNVEYISEFLSGTNIKGGIYSRKSDYNVENTSTYGTFDFIPNLKEASSAFSNSGILFLDTNIFAPYEKNGLLIYSKIQNVDYMFANCPKLKVYITATQDSLIQGGRLKSKTFFTNLRNSGRFPLNMFQGCTYVEMDIESKQIGDVIFDYLFHWPEELNLIRGIDTTIYSGIKLIGTINDNVFGGRLLDDGEGNYIVQYASIEAPFQNSGNDNLLCNLGDMGKMFNLQRDTLYLAKYVFSGIKFIDSLIPIDIFSGCVNLSNISGFFSNLSITNNGLIFEFPLPLMFNDCISLNNVSNLFSGDYNLNIKLLGNGFINTALIDVESMLQCSGVFGMIPYKLFYMERNGVVQLTIEKIGNVFNQCFKLGYTVDRSFIVGATIMQDFNIYKTTYLNCVLENPGERVYFHIDEVTGDDPWQIDGVDWAEKDPQLVNSPLYAELNEAVFLYDRKLKLALSNNMDRETGYLNYIIPADYFRYCSSACTMNNAFNGCSYEAYTLGYENGYGYLIKIEEKLGLVGRLPCKLFSLNTGNRTFSNVFKGLDYCAFVNFDSYLFNTINGPSASECRGIKFPPDLLKNNINIENISGMFSGGYIETGVDINSDIFRYNTNLVNVSNVFSNTMFHKEDFVGTNNGLNGQIDYENLFKYNPNLEDVSYLFASSYLDGNYGLQIIRQDLFGVDNNVPYNPRIKNIAGMFLYNVSLVGSIPLFETSIFKRILSYNGYINGVSKGNISNTYDYMNEHDNSWIPLDWIDE